MTFKEARAMARTKGGAYIGIFKQKEQGWFVDGRYPGLDPRAIFYVYRDGRLRLVETEFAKRYYRNYQKKYQKPLDK